MPIRDNISVFLAKLEAGGYGVDASPAAADAIFLLSPPKFKPNHTSNQVDGITGSASTKTPVGGGTHWDISLEWANKGSGSPGVAPEFGPLLQSCGMKETVVASTSVAYTPDLAQKKSSTLYFYTDGLLYKALGFRGKSSFQGDAGAFGKWSVTGKAIFVAPADAALVASPVFDSTKPVPIVGQTFTFDTYAAILRSFGFDTGVDFNAIPAVGPTYGVSSIEQGKFNVTGSMTVEHTLVAARAWETNLADDDAGGSLSYQMGATAGNITTITAPAVKITDLDKQANGGILDLLATFKMSESASLRDDFTVTYT